MGVMVEVFFGFIGVVVVGDIVGGQIVFCWIIQDVVN